MKKLIPLAMIALIAAPTLALAQQGFDYNRRDGVAVGEPRPDRGGRDWDRGERRDRDWDRDRRASRDWQHSGRRDWDRGRGNDFERGLGLFVRTLTPRYRTVMVSGRPCRITITRRQRDNGTIVTTERRSC